MATKKRTLPKTWAEYCKLTGRNPKAFPDTSMYETEKDKRNAIANFILPLVIKYCNGDTPPNYHESDEYKYEPRWRVKADKKRPSGFGLSYCDYDFWTSNSYCGPRFAFIRLADLIHVTKYFVKYYEDLMLL